MGKLSVDLRDLAYGIVICLYLLVWLVSLNFFSENKILGNQQEVGAFLIFLVLLLAVLMVSQFWADRVVDELAYLLSTLMLISLFVFGYAHWYFYGGVLISCDEITPCKLDTEVDSLYFSLVSITTLGYGDATPQGTTRLVAASEAMIGFLFAPLMIAQFVNLIQDYKKLRQAARVQEIREQRLQERTQSTN